MSDAELLSCIDRYGANANQWRRRFLGVLPEATRRELHLKRRLAGPAELASRKCGVSRGVVKRVLHLDKSLVAFPRLRAMLEQGTVGWAKLEAVVGELTPDEEEFWVEEVKRKTRSKLRKLVLQRQEARKASGAPSPDGGPPAGTKPPEDEAQGRSANKRLLDAAARNASGDYSAPPVERNERDDSPAPPAARNERDDSPAPAAARNEQGDSLAPPESGFDRGMGRHQESDEGCESGLRRGPGVGCEAEGPQCPVFAPSPLVAERFLAMTEKVGGTRADGRGPSIDERLTYLLDHFVPGADARVRYQEVVNFDEVRGTRVVATRFGDELVTEVDLAGKVRLSEPLDLADERVKAREAAVAYVSRRRERGLPPGRHIPIPVRRYLKLRDQGFCAVPGCRARATHVHHLDRFVLHPEPWPDRLASYCSLHGDLAHEGSLRGESGALGSVRVGLLRAPTTAEEAARARVDTAVRRHRRRACAERHPPDDIFDEPGVDPMTLFDDADEYEPGPDEGLDEGEIGEPGDADPDHGGIFAGEAETESREAPGARSGVAGDVGPAEPGGHGQ